MLTLATMSHHTAPIAVRERIAIPADALDAATARAQVQLGPSAILSTCNRFELYVSGDHDPARLLAFIAAETGADETAVQRHFAVHRDTEAVRHLYRVASGIESLVLGEFEIMGQLRGAFSVAAGAGMEDAILVHVMHGAIRAGRRARHETAIGHHAMSVSSIAARQARDLHPRIADARVLVIGAGEAGRLTAEALVDQGVTHVTVTNRTFARAESLAAELGGRAVPFEDLPAAIATDDIVVAASGAPGTLVDLELMRAAVERREGAPLIAIDIGMPRDFDPAIASLPGVSYYDMEGLQEIAAANGRARAEELPAVEAVLAEEIADFVAWCERLRTKPTIASLTSHAEEIRIAAVEKSLRRLPADDDLRREVDALTRTIVKRLLHDPITTLRNRGDREQHYIEAVRTLFQLDGEAAVPSFSEDAPHDSDAAG
ncbi:MAG: glutamyl-tRNA reductase [Chloroflexi bacterium]|nr:glutamyl-tRNA reductase [Chloroflexota bacterium]MDA1147272.1 glutamyl-tRNA reductase [Chloroflexota bacterium]